MSLISKGFRFLTSSLTFNNGFHSSALLLRWREKRNPKNKMQIKKPVYTWPLMVGRGLRLEKAPTEQTIEPIRTVKTGGRGVHGQTESLRQGGGDPVDWHMVDKQLISADEESPRVERVLDIIKCDTRSAFIALVARGEQKRWILAAESYEIGGLVKSHNVMPDFFVKPAPGECYPVGAFATGTAVCFVERVPFQGAKIACGAGSSCMVTAHSGDTVTLRMPSKREMVVDKQCLAVCGKSSNIHWQDRVFGTAGEKRRQGYRPSSGWRKKKTGLQGRKIHPPKPAIDYTLEVSSKAVPVGVYTFASYNPFDKFIPK